ncbi:hypothetical protein [Novosphingobium sp. Leaf2]|uniref:hypothetical protein n=1 Tax=Novosphingobium sp. Leaf2 TaxID=1735670 RepID=UPI000A892302|nr:hypothetical protein [Novosphingobium sp. Leaf2]
MTVIQRKAGLAGAIAIIVLLALVVLGIAAWRDAGVQPVQDMTVAVPLPDSAK